MRKTVAILGVLIDDVNQSEAVDRIEDFVRSGRFHQVATANTDFLIKALDDPELKNILRDSDMVVPDGMPLVLASRWLKSGLRERVTGADLVPAVAKRAAANGWRVFMLGARPEIAAMAKARLETENPGIQIVGCVSPPLGHIVTMDNEAVLQQIEEARPDILLVAFGNPKQEKWIYMHRSRLKVPACIGVGGTFDFLAGAAPRAPMWVQRAGMEWLHRLVNDPRRLWRRYASDVVHFARLICLQLWVMRKGSNSARGAHLREARVGDYTVISVTGSLGGALLPDFQAMADGALNAPSHLVLDLHSASHIDSAVLGTLMNLPKRAAYVDRTVSMVGAPRQLCRALKMSNADTLVQFHPTLAEALAAGSSERLTVRIDEGGKHVTAGVWGHADVVGAPAMMARLNKLCATCAEVSLDLSGLHYVDSGTLSTLRWFVRERSRVGQRVTVTCGEVVREALRREKLNGLFDPPPTESPKA